jgi:amino acid permease
MSTGYEKNRVSGSHRDLSPGPAQSILTEGSHSSQEHKTELRCVVHKFPHQHTVNTNILARQDLKERHVNMLAFSSALGVGLFLGGGRIIFMAGPGLAVIAYLLVGTVMWSTMASLGEMTAVFPVKGPLFEFPRRFLDQSIGFATAWVVW